ncbi:MAG: ATP-binding cassette domain-containing protein [Alphaproteobacteria bacterium]|nr:ATP-binding cassette domain-containing protein [Alphaproteobacteria bacterium]
MATAAQTRPETEVRLAARLAAAGLPDAPAEVAELATHLVYWALPDDVPDRDALDEVAAAVAALAGVDPAVARVAAAVAAEPEHRQGIDSDDLDAFTGRFGAAAGRFLGDDADPAHALADWAAGRPADRVVELLDQLVRVAARCGDQPRLDADSWRRLREAADALEVGSRVLADLVAEHAPAVGRWRLVGPQVRVGHGPGCDLLIPDPRVAEHHLSLIHTDGTWRVVDAGSGRPTLLHGAPITSAPLRAGEPIRVGPYALVLDEDLEHATLSGEASPHVLSARKLTRHIGEVTLLDDLSFTALSGEVIAVVGPSGAGKTTLLNAITGIAPADSGVVELDGRDFHALLTQDRSLVGSVPQDDIVHPELTVAESLAYSARLRLPPGQGSAGVDTAVDRVLGELGIAHIRGSRIGDALRRGISGGQRKRVNLGQELLSKNTSILFLDEPTSGLDPQSAQDIVRLVRQLADRGRVVFLVTHDLSPQVMAQVDHLMVLVPGGRLAWFGPPAAACRYFGVPTADAVFNRFGDKTAEQWADAWRRSPACRRNVHAREAATSRRPPEPAPAATTRRRPGGLLQWATLLRRYARVKARDRTGLWVLGAQPPFLALVMFVVFPEPTSELLFMLTLSCLWFGMSAAVRELISDRAVWRRERRVGVGVLPYVGSKVAVLGLISVLQCAVLALAIWAGFGMGGEYGFDPLLLAGLSSLVGLCGMSLGLAMSALFSSSEAAVGTLPLLLIPQISFSALLVNLRDMGPVARALTWVDPMRYAFEAVIKAGERIAKPTRVPGKWEARSFTAPLYDYGFKGSGADDTGLAMVVLVAALCGFTALFMVTALLAVWRRRD